MTLLELLLVLGVLVIVAAMAAPAMFGVWETQKLRDAGDLVRADWGRARIKAMKSGRIHVFQYVADTGEYRIEPWYSDTDDDQSIDEIAPSGDMALTSASATGSSLGGGDPAATTRLLPEGISFVSCRTALDVRGQASGNSGANANSAAGAADGAQPVMFYPDGTTSTTELVLGNTRERYLVLSMRGLTGVARASEILAAEELPQ